MITILTAFICLRGVCMEVSVPTPIAFKCDDSPYYEQYLKANYPNWRFRLYKCEEGRYL